MSSRNMNDGPHNATNTNSSEQTHSPCQATAKTVRKINTKVDRMETQICTLVREGREGRKEVKRVLDEMHRLVVQLKTQVYSMDPEMKRSPSTPPIHRSVRKYSHVRTEQQSYSSDEDDFNDDSSDGLSVTGEEDRDENISRETNNSFPRNLETTGGSNQSISDTTKCEKRSPEDTSVHTSGRSNATMGMSGGVNSGFAGNLNTPTNTSVKEETGNENVNPIKEDEYDFDDVEIIDYNAPKEHTGTHRNPLPESHQPTNQATETTNGGEDIVVDVEGSTSDEENNQGILNDETEVQNSDDEIGDLNSIFDSEQSEKDVQYLGSETAKRKKNSDGSHKKISGIGKAPLKEESRKEKTKSISVGFFDPYNDDDDVNSQDPSFSSPVRQDASAHLPDTPRNRGLNNLGNTCYINSLMQAVLSLPFVEKDVLSSPMRQFYELIFESEKSNHMVRDARDALDEMLDHHFKAGTQNDSCELFQKILQHPESNSLRSCFVSIERELKKCYTCDDKRVSVNENIEYYIQPNIPFQEAVRISTQSKETVECNCEDCGASVMELDKMILKPPNALLFVTRIFGSNLKKILELDPNTAVDSISVNTENGSENYSLISYVTHKGSTRDSGHYKAYVKVNSNWLCCNDHIVEKLDGRVLGEGETVYMRFFVRNTESCMDTAGPTANDSTLRNTDTENGHNIPASNETDPRSNVGSTNKAFSHSVNRNRSQPARSCTRIPSPVNKTRLPTTTVKREAHALNGYSEARGGWDCICGHLTDTKHGLMVHVREKGSEEPRYKCPECTKRFKHINKVRRHLEIEHRWSEFPTRLSYCRRCGKVAMDKRDLDNHKNEKNRRCRPRVRKLNDGSCNRAFTNGGGLHSGKSSSTLKSTEVPNHEIITL